MGAGPPSRRLATFACVVFEWVRRAGLDVGRSVVFLVQRGVVLELPLNVLLADSN